MNYCTKMICTKPVKKFMQTNLTFFIINRMDIKLKQLNKNTAD